MLGAVGEECQGSTVMPGKLSGIDCGEKMLRMQRCMWFDGLLSKFVHYWHVGTIYGQWKFDFLIFPMTCALESLLLQISKSGSSLSELLDPRLIIQSIRSCFNYLRWQGSLDSTCHPSCFLSGLWFNVVSRYWHVKVANLFSFR